MKMLNTKPPEHLLAKPKTRRKYARYTPEEDAIVMANAGKVPAQETAAQIGRSKQSVYCRMQALGVHNKLRGASNPNSKLDELRVKMIKTLYGAGYTPREIHDVMRVPCPVCFAVVQRVCHGETWAHIEVDTGQK